MSSEEGLGNLRGFPCCRLSAFQCSSVSRAATAFESSSLSTDTPMLVAVVATDLQMQMTFLPGAAVICALTLTVAWMVLIGYELSHAVASLL